MPIRCSTFEPKVPEHSSSHDGTGAGGLSPALLSGVRTFAPQRCSTHGEGSMTANRLDSPRADYGLDAPSVVRKLLVIGGVGLLLAVAAALHLLPAVLTWTLGGSGIRFPLVPLGLGPGVALTVTGLSMIWSSRVGKVRRREALLEQFAWKGDEQVLDMVLSYAAIHNLDDAADRDRAIQEIVRVLKPGGFGLVDDIRHSQQYRKTFAAHGYRLVRRLDQPLASIGWMVLTWGALQPATPLVQKAV